MSYNPAKVLGIADSYGRITEGAKADIVLFDPNEEWEVDSSKFLSKGHNTPYNGKVLKGKVKMTIVDGCIKYKE